jgi:iron complex transport system permease protein
LLSSGIVLALSSRKEASPESMVLTGLALLFFFQAMTTILQYFGDSDAVKAAIFWTVGDLGKADWSKLGITAPLVLVGTCLLYWKARDLNIMNAGDESAKSLGINVMGTRIFTMIVCTLMVAGIVSFTGTIGFIGLVAPHLVRMLTGTDNKILVPASGLLGAVLLVLSDTVARTILSPVILPVGAVTAFLGVPLFVYLIVRKSGNIL